MNIELYADGSDLTDMVNVYRHNKYVKGFTTNPTLMRKAKVGNYLEFVGQVTDVIKDLPVSFEVFADDFPEMERQAKVLASYGENIFVKIPVTNTKGQSTKQLVKSLLDNMMVSIHVTHATSHMPHVTRHIACHKSKVTSHVSICIRAVGL